MPDASSFDVTLTVDLQEVDNAINQARKEVGQRYDFKGSPAAIEFNKAESTMTLVAEDAFKMDQLWDILQTRLVRSGLGVRFHRAINAHHRSIAAAIEAGDEEAAGEEMHDHVVFLRPFYEKAWRDLGKRG